MTPSLEFGLYLFIYLINTFVCWFRMAKGFWFVFPQSLEIYMRSQSAKWRGNTTSKICLYIVLLSRKSEIPVQLSWDLPVKLSCSCSAAVHTRPCLTGLTFTACLGFIQGSWTWALKSSLSPLPAQLFTDFHSLSTGGSSSPGWSQTSTEVTTALFSSYVVRIPTVQLYPKATTWKKEILTFHI